MGNRRVLHAAESHGNADASRSHQGQTFWTTHEIQRLIGRSLRSVVDLRALGERSIIVDCDVLQADGGTRTAAITGSYVALVIALRTLVKHKALAKLPLTDSVGRPASALLTALRCSI